jgi:uncharacterized membrane protein YgcG
MNAIRRSRILSLLVGIGLFACLILTGCSGDTKTQYISDISGGAQVAAPANPTVTAGDGSATVSWDAVDDAEAYNLYWSTAPFNDIAQANQVAGVSSPYTMAGLVNGIPYYFRVVAVCTNRGAESLPSAGLSVVPKPTPPGAPDKISAMAGDTFVVLQWTPVPGAVSYNIYWQVKAGITKTAGERFMGVVSSPYIHYVPISDTGAIPGAGGGGMGGGGGHSGGGSGGSSGGCASSIAGTISPGVAGMMGPPEGKGPKQTGTMFFYAVSAVDQYGQESPLSAEVGAAPKRPGGMPGGEEGAFSSNLAVPLIFAEGYGFGGLPVAEPVTEPTGTKLYANTGLRNSDAPPGPFWSDVFEELYMKDGITYYMQKTSSAWQAEWRNGAGAPVGVTVDWSDNITGHVWSANSMIHVEHVLYQAPVDDLGNPTDLMTGYAMTHLFGARYSEKFGTTGETILTNYRTVFSPNVRLKIEKITGPGGDPDPLYNGGLPVIDQAVYQGFGADGPGRYGSEVNGSGKLVYGYNFALKKLTGDKVGWWRLTFSIDPVATYTVAASEGGTPVAYEVQANTTFVSLDPSDDKTDAKFRPVLTSPTESVLEIQVTESKGGGGGSGGSEGGGSGGGGGGCGE